MKKVPIYVRHKISKTLKGRPHPHPKTCRHCLALKHRVRWKLAKDTGCWVWLGATNELGYAVAWNPKTNNTSLAARVVYEKVVGEIPKGFVPDHKCRNLRCVRPHKEHIVIVTNYQNVSQNRKGLKLSLDLVSKIREEHRKNRRHGLQVELAKRFNVSVATISMLLRGKRWPQRNMV